MKNKILLITAAFALAALTAAPQTQAAKMALSPSEGKFKIGCSNTVNVIINTEGIDSNAADAFLNYDPSQIEILGIGAGNVYKAYPGRQFGNGSIRITAFNSEGVFNGRGTLATLTFQAKPGVTQSAINFNFTQGSSTDSNVADLSANDVLSGAYNGNYTFITGKCTGDITPPAIDERNPEPGAINVPLDSNLDFFIKDTGSGLDLDSVEVTINGTTYTTKDNEAFTATKEGNGYKITINPALDFLANEPVKVVVKAKDKDGNTMTDLAYSFNELRAIGSCPVETLRSAAPARAYLYGYLTFLILFLISAAFNLYQYLILENHLPRKNASFKTHTIITKNGKK
jgi:hypothetical protein